MSKPISKPVQQKFKNKKGIAKWINDDTREKEYSDETAEYIVSRQINWRYNFSDKAIIEKDGESYIYDKVKHTITAVVEPKKETGWFDSYHECLRIAKEILTGMECQQLTLDFK